MTTGLGLIITGCMIVVLTLSVGHGAAVIIKGLALSVVVIIAGCCLMFHVRSFTEFISFILFWT